MRKFTLYVGHKTRDSRSILHSAFVAATIRDQLAAFGIAGATMWEASGIWQGKAEPTTVVEVLAEDDDWLVIESRLLAMCRVLNNLLHQECIGLSVAVTDFRLV